MAKKAILEVLESTIGRYVHNLDAESLNVAVWSGKIELHNLQLDVSAVNTELCRRAHEAPNLASPFRVCSGNFDSVQLDVPWARLSSRPVVFRARGLKVLMEPYDFLKEEEDRGASNSATSSITTGPMTTPMIGQKYNSVLDERSKSITVAEANRQRANAVRKAWEEDSQSTAGDDMEYSGDSSAANSNNNRASGADSSSSSSTFTSRLVRRILENLQVEVDDVHLAVRGCGCAAGLVLESLSLVTTDSKGTRTFVDRKTNIKDPESSFLYKELVISGLGIYLQHDDDTNNVGRHQIIIKGIEKATSYVLSPLSFQAKLRQSDLDHCVDFPKYLVHSKLSSLSIQLSRTQLELGQRLALTVAAPKFELRPLFPEYRPLEPILPSSSASGGGNAKLWWKYAVRCIGRLNRHRSWMEFYAAYRKRKSYLKLYKRHVHAEGAPWLTKLLDSEREELDRIEFDRSISIAGLMLWRTIADAQVAKERQKHIASKQRNVGGVVGISAIASTTPVKPKSSLLKLFGSTPRKESSSSDTFYECLDDGEESRPITLTPDEMKELEELALKTADRSLTKDSMFCDVNFNLGSFQVNLLTALNKPLTSLEMGMVSASFKANANGSFTSGLSLLSLEIIDSVTPNTFFPTICRSLQKAHSKKTHAFQFQLKKTKEGDQELVLKMVACEIVASPMLLFAIKEFFKLPTTSSTIAQRSSSGRINPMLYESVSGDADIFFDAKEGMASLLTPLAAKPEPHFSFSSPSKRVGVTGGGLHGSAIRDEKVSSKLSSAIMDAWNGKNKQKQQWKIDFDISAPILILPENCTDASATVLICNFGRFKFIYGTEALSTAVLEWFGSHQRAHRKDSVIDHLNLEMNDLSFTVSSVLDASKNTHDEMVAGESSSIIEPVSFTLNIGLEHTISSGEDIPRTCVIGVLPGIVLRLAPSHVTKILRVAAIWSSNLNTLRGNGLDTSNRSAAMLSEVDEEASDSDLEIMSSGSGISLLDEETPSTPVVGESTFVRSRKIILHSMLMAKQNNEGSNAIEFMHVSVSLLKLSINVYTDHGDGVEAHLVSVVASSSLITDGTSSIRLSMGWFWILDRLRSDHQVPRRQRLVFHSNLPRSATEYADNDNYSEIMNDLTILGVFKPSFAGSAELVDVNIVKLRNSKARAYHDEAREFSRSYMQSISNSVDGATIVNAKFTSLFVNWNPLAIKTLFAAKSDVLDFKERAFTTYESMSKIHHNDLRLSSQQDKPIPIDNTGNSIFILAEMEHFEISLNSAQDDLPLFTMTMSGSRVNYHRLEGSNENSEISLVVGDFRMEAISSEKIIQTYRTILGLAPCVSTSLLTVKYSKGANAVGLSNVGGADITKCEACAEIVLSPMRFVHIHSQVFTLIEYFSEGVFGAMAASVASSAAAAAMQVAKSSQDKERLFYVVATGFTFVLPQAAYSEKHFSFHAGNFKAHYRALGDDIGSNILLALHDVSMNCSQNLNMVTDPVIMSVVVDLKPPFLPGTEDERATRISMSISRILLQVSRCHYAQIMHTLDNNIGERDTFLREQLAYRVSQNYRGTLSKTDAVNTIMKNLSHAGVENVEVIRRMYIDFHIQELSVKLCRDNTDDPIVSFAAVNAHILMKLLPDEKQMKAHLALHDLVCDDRRKGTADRTFRRMFGRANVHELNKGGESEVFLLNYTKCSDDGARDIEVKIGSSQVVVLPDVISDMLNFIKIAPSSQRKQDSLPLSTQSKYIHSESTHIVVTDDIPNQVEASFESIGIDGGSELKKTNYQIESSNMRLVLVDLGNIDSSGSFVATKSGSALNETIVLQGKMQAKFQMTSDVTDTVVEKDYKIDAERVEIYSAQGVYSLHPVQILEPAKFAIFYYQKVCNRRAEHSTDLKFVTLSPIDVTISMQNAALASTLASSITDSFAIEEGDSAGDNEFHPLSTTDQNRIARLDSALMKDTDEPSEDSSEQISRLSSHAGDLRSMRRSTRLKMTSPEATLTVINDFQGLDEALFKISSINAVVGGEISYPGVSDNEKPCFECSLNTSILADYFDAASQRWTMLLTSPWELTLNALRAPQTRTMSKRLSSNFDIESSQCHVSFTEHFLVNVGAASRMWSVYSGATKQANALAEDTDAGDLGKRRLSRSMAACAARSLIATLPYAIENHSGLSAFYSIYDYAARSPLPTNSTQFFRFELFPERGTGGMRRYGQDIKCPKRINIHIGGTEISIRDLDHEVNKSRTAYYIPELRVHVFLHVVKRGKSTVLHLSSRVEIHNTSSLPFRISVVAEDSVKDLGIVTKSQKRHQSLSSESLLKERKDLMTYSVFGLPAQLLRSVTVDTAATLCLQISPVLQNSDDAELFGMFNLPSFQRLLGIARTDDKRVIEVVCSPASRTSRSSSLGANIRCKVTLVDEAHPFVELFIEPRVILRNNIPVSLIVRTPMPHTFISTIQHLDNAHGEPEDPSFTTHRVGPLDSIEVFTPGPSIAISLKCADLPVGGTTTGWVDGNFIDIPLKGLILEPLRCTFPFETKSLDRYESSRQFVGPISGNDFYIIEAGDVTPDLKEKGKSSHSPSLHGTVRTVSFIVCNYSVDHTGTLLFEKVSGMGENEILKSSKLIRGSPPYSAFSSTHHRRRVTLLPESTAFIRLVELTMEGEIGMKRSVPFRIEDVSMTEGIDSFPIMWADFTPSGYFAYRNLTAEGSELHVVPEFVIFNGSEHQQIRVMQLAEPSFLLEPSKISPISRDKNNSIVVQFEVPAIYGLTGPVQIDQVGLRICVIKSKQTGEALGSLAVQTITGARDSRLVVKIGALTIREAEKIVENTGLFAHDFIRFRVRWSALRVTLKDTEESFERYEENRAAIRKYLEHHNVNSVELEKKLTEARHEYNVAVDKQEKSFPDVAQVFLHRFTVDFQRIFKEYDSEKENKKSQDLFSSERAQFSVVVHNVRIIDCSPNTESSVVFDSMSDTSFFDLCIRTRGPLDADLIRVDLFDLNLAYGDGKARQIVVNTGEDFVWRLLDIANRTMLATAELAGVDLDLKWDDKAGKFAVAISDPKLRGEDDLDADGNYRPPRSDKLYDVKTLRVSPFTLLFSFKRQPQTSRYQIVRGTKGAKLTNYFTTRLKFTIDKADLRFQGYLVRNIKGPPDRIADTIKAVYTTQLKSKMVSLLTATSFQDWKYLTARDSGGEEFMEGDLLRMGGNLAGRSAKFVLKKSGDFIGDTLVSVTGTIGGGIQEATESIGLGQVGAGVNSVVSGLGEGVSSGVKGVGTGAGDIIRGAGKGIGQIIGGLGGGAQIVGKGIVKGDTSEVGAGFATMGDGIGQGLGSAVDGAVSGVVSLGRGLFSGAKSVGVGIGGVFTGQEPPPRPPSGRGRGRR